MVNWLELIEEKEDQILAEGEKAYKEAINNPHLRYIVEIDENGDVYSWYDVAGGNSFHVSTNALESKLIEKGYKKELEELAQLASENQTSIEVEIINGDNDILKEFIEECRKEEIDFMISEYARSESENKLDYFKEVLKSLQ